MSLNIIKAFATKNPCYKEARQMTPKGILVHSTGVNNPNLKRYVDAPNEVGVNQYNNTWNTSTTEVCVHAFIGKDKNNKVRVAQILPYNYACWGCGRGTEGSYNYDPDGHIQFEMCEDDLKDESYFNQIYDTAVEYCAELCKTYKFDPLNDIVSHKEAAALGYASSHIAPHNWFDKFGKTMDRFRKDVKTRMSTKEETPKNADTLYRVQVGAFSNTANAANYQTKIKAAGFTAIIVKVKDLYKVQVGAYKEKANADSMVKKLKTKGFDGFVTKISGKVVNVSSKEDKKTLSAGVAVTLTNAELYASASSSASVGTVTGKYYIWDNAVNNGKIRITNSKANVGNANQVTGFVKITDCK